MGGLNSSNPILGTQLVPKLQRTNTIHVLALN